MTMLQQIERLCSERRFPEAARLLLQGAEGGDPVALVELAHWRIAGNVIHRDLSKARSLLHRAWINGDLGAGLLYASFLGAGVGGHDDWRGALSTLERLSVQQPKATTQLTLIKNMAIDLEGQPATGMEREVLSEHPHVELALNLFTPAECTYLLRAAEPQFQRSLVADPRTGRMVPHPVRRSDAAMFGVYGEDVAINALNRRIAAFSGTDPAQGEPLQVLRYGPTDEYRAHLDTLPAEPNQRIATVLVYLSDDYEGGETAFLKTGLKVRGNAGDAIFFRNVTSTGEPDRMSEHAGLPVTRGIKHIASRWIRAGRFTYPPPQPLLAI